MKIMVFLHGTIIMHSGGLGKTSEERVRQVEENEKTVYKYENYVPVGKANKKLKSWVQQGAEIIYLSSQQNDENVTKDIKVLGKYNFPEAPVLFRHKNETYSEIVLKVMPDILIEDDCESIGGESEMIFFHMNRSQRKKIKSIIVEEFSGIDNLPDNLEILKNFS